MDFSAFDFRDDFALHEIASLCIGLDPAHPMPSDNDPSRTAYREIVSAATASAEMANAECARAHFENRARPSLYPNLLYTTWALQRIPTKTGEPAWEEIGRDRWPEEGFDPSIVEEWRFDRQTVANWLSGRLFKPVYDFSRPGGLLVGAKDETPMALNPTTEATYLTIIGALLELILGKTPAGKPQSVFDSQAAIIDALLAHHEHKRGISKTTLEAKFAHARRRLNST